MGNSNHEQSAWRCRLLRSGSRRQHNPIDIARRPFDTLDAHVPVVPTGIRRARRRLHQRENGLLDKQRSDHLSHVGNMDARWQPSRSVRYVPYVNSRVSIPIRVEDRSPISSFARHSPISASAVPRTSVPRATVSSVAGRAVDAHGLARGGFGSSDAVRWNHGDTRSAGSRWMPPRRQPLSGARCTRGCRRSLLPQPLTTSPARTRAPQEQPNSLQRFEPARSRLPLLEFCFTTRSLRPC